MLVKIFLTSVFTFLFVIPAAAVENKLSLEILPPKDGVSTKAVETKPVLTEEVPSTNMLTHKVPYSVAFTVVGLTALLATLVVFKTK